MQFLVNKLALMKTHWPQVLWGLLLLGLSMNIIYLFWPEPPETFVIKPDPSAFQTAQKMTIPILAQDQNQHYLIVKKSSSGNQKTLIPLATPSLNEPLRHHFTHPKKKNFTGTLNLNTASATQLQLLPGVGPKMANRILMYRQQHGRFHSIEQLQDIAGIGPKKFAKLSPHCTL